MAKPTGLTVGQAGDSFVRLEFEGELGVEGFGGKCQVLSKKC